MLVNFLFLVFIVYLIYIYNNLQNNKYLNLENYLKHASLIVERLEKENQILKDQKNNFENKVIENDINLKNLNQNLDSKKYELMKLNKNYNEEKEMNQSFAEIFKQSEKNLYEQISDLKYNSKKSNQEFEEIKKENVILKNQQEILFKFLKLSDYALYEELLKRI